MLQSRLMALRADAGALDRRLQHQSPERDLAAGRSEIDRLRTRLRSGAKILVPNRREILVAESRGMRLGVHGCVAEDRGAYEQATAVLTALDPRRTLRRGYAAIERRDGKVVTSAAEISPGEQLIAYFADGRVEATATTMDASGGVGHND
jgi:exodeoxyribonuclease VII large subunit